jgi:hypothetical protein
MQNGRRISEMRRTSEHVDRKGSDMGVKYDKRNIGKRVMFDASGYRPGTEPVSHGAVGTVKAFAGKRGHQYWVRVDFGCGSLPVGPDSLRYVCEAGTLASEAT